MLPVENSLGGSIHIVYDLLLRYRLHIVGEVTVKVIIGGGEARLWALVLFDNWDGHSGYLSLDLGT